MFTLSLGQRKADAVVVRDILENSSTWAGVPAKKISNKDSMCNLLIEV